VLLQQEVRVGVLHSAARVGECAVAAGTLTLDQIGGALVLGTRPP